MLKQYAKSLLDRQLNQPIQEAPNKDIPAPKNEAVSPAYEVPSPPPSSLSSLSKQVETKVSSYDEPETIIGEKVSIRGSLTFERLIRIDGSFEGDLTSEGKIIIGPKGYVKSDLNLSEAFISGTVEGNITVKKRLVLRGRAVIHGDIKASSLSVDEGVSLIGKVEVIPTTSHDLED